MYKQIVGAVYIMEYGEEYISTINCHSLYTAPLWICIDNYNYIWKE